MSLVCQLSALQFVRLMSIWTRLDEEKSRKKINLYKMIKIISTSLRRCYGVLEPKVGQTLKILFRNKLRGKLRLTDNIRDSVKARLYPGKMEKKVLPAD